jgi:hypothetical protein
MMSPLECRRIVARVRAEFSEMPGLQLTASQAARLWGLEMPLCLAVIDELVQSAFLRWTSSRRIARVES